MTGSYWQFIMAKMAIDAALKCSKNIQVAETQLEVNLLIADHCMKNGMDPGMYLLQARNLMSSLEIFRNNRNELLDDLNNVGGTDLAAGIEA